MARAKLSAGPPNARIKTPNVTNLSVVHILKYTSNQGRITQQPLLSPKLLLGRLGPAVNIQLSIFFPLHISCLPAMDNDPVSFPGSFFQAWTGTTRGVDIMLVLLSYFLCSRHRYVGAVGVLGTRNAGTIRQSAAWRPRQQRTVAGKGLHLDNKANRLFIQ